MYGDLSFQGRFYVRFKLMHIVRKLARNILHHNISYMLKNT